MHSDYSSYDLSLGITIFRLIVKHIIVCGEYTWIIMWDQCMTKKVGTN